MINIWLIEYFIITNIIFLETLKIEIRRYSARFSHSKPKAFNSEFIA